MKKRSEKVHKNMKFIFLITLQTRSLTWNVEIKQLPHFCVPFWHTNAWCMAWKRRWRGWKTRKRRNCQPKLHFSSRRRDARIYSLFFQPRNTFEKFDNMQRQSLEVNTRNWWWIKSVCAVRKEKRRWGETKKHPTSVLRTSFHGL